MHEIMSAERRFSTPSRGKDHSQRTHDDQESNQSHSLTAVRAKTSHEIEGRLLNRQRVKINDLETSHETQTDMDKHIADFLARNNLNRRRKSLPPLVYDGTRLRQQKKGDISMVTEKSDKSNENHADLVMSSVQHSPGISRTQVPIPPGLHKRSMSIDTTESHNQQRHIHSQRTGVTNLPGHSKRSMSIHVTGNDPQQALHHFGRRLSHRGSLNPMQFTDIMPHAPNRLPVSYSRQRESDRRRSLTDPEWTRRRLSQPAACFRQRESDRRLSFTDPEHAELTHRRMSQHDVFADPVYNPFLSRKFGHAGSAENSIKPIRRLSRDIPCLSPNCIHCRPGRTRLSDLSDSLDKDIAEGEAVDESVSNLAAQFEELKNCRYLRVPHNSSEDESFEEG